MSFIYKKVQGEKGGGKRQLKSSPGWRLSSGCPFWLFLGWGQRARENDRPRLVGSVVPATDLFALARLGFPLGVFGVPLQLQAFSLVSARHNLHRSKKQSFSQLGHHFTIRVQLGQEGWPQASYHETGLTCLWSPHAPPASLSSACSGGVKKAL